MSDPITQPVSDTDPSLGELPAPDYARIHNQRKLMEVLARRKRAREERQVLAMCESHDAMAVMMRLLSFCGLYHTTEGSAHAEGRRQVALWLLSEINRANPDLYPILLQEHAARMKTWQAEDASITENHRRKSGVARRMWRRSADAVGAAASRIKDAVW
jgi:hypothetical protein